MLVKQEDYPSQADSLQYYFLNPVKDTFLHGLWELHLDSEFVPYFLGIYLYVTI